MTTPAPPNHRADAAAPPAAAGSSSSRSSGAASPSPSPASPLPVSTVASAGKNNSYIWTKADYFFGSKCECNAPASSADAAAPPCDKEDEEEELVAAGAGVPSPSNLWLYVRAALIGVFVASNALVLVNFFVLPMNLAAFGWILFRVVRHSSSSGSGGRSPTADQQLHSCDCSEIKSSRWNPLVLRATDLLVGWFLSMVSTVVERVMGMRVRLAGDVLTEEQRGEGALIISNHPSTADWIYIWSWLVRQGDMSTLKIALKRSLHSSPIVGWALQCARYLFLARDWQKDQAHIESVVKHWASTGAPLAGVLDSDAKGAASSTSSASPSPSPVQLLLFPEGTDLRPVSYDQSCAFVRKSAASGKAVVPLQHVLQPRTTGFVHIVQLLRQTGSIKAVYDLTLGSTPVPVTIENFARGVVPSEFSVHAQRFEVSSLPQSDADLAAWLQQRWVEKDARLEGFYSATPRAFPTSPAQQQLAARSARQLQFRQFSLLAAFVLMFLLHAYCWFAAPLLLLLAHASLSAVWVYITRQYGGFDALMIKIDQMDQKDTHANKKDK